MEIYRIVGVGLSTLICVLVVKQLKPEIAIIIGVCGGIIVVLMAVDSLSNILTAFNILVSSTGLSQNLFKTILKIIGIGYLTEFASNVCIDAGSSGLANKILLAGKIIILSVSMPVVTNIIEIITGLLV